MQSPSPISNVSPLLPGEPAAAEHVEELLLDAVVVRRRRPAARRDLDPADADADAAGGLAEERPGALQVADAELAARRLVEVRDPHARRLYESARPRNRLRNGFPGRNPSRLLGPGLTAAPERNSLALLPSGPDAVRRLPVRGTRPSTLRAWAQAPKNPPLGRYSAPLERIASAGNR